MSRLLKIPVTLIAATWIAMLLSSQGSTNRAECLWDRDTLRDEALGRPGTLEILTGRFDRQPAEFYQDRLARTLPLLSSPPTPLNLFDDCGVAYDRIHEGTEAINMMDRKLREMDSFRANPARAEEHVDLDDHTYRYLANLGTFHIHRWVDNGRNMADTSDLSLAREYITKAIEINPDAHFGRERYQLLAVEWVLHDHQADPIERPTFLHMIPGFAERTSDQIRYNAHILEDLGYEDVIEGLTGIVTMGAGWESIDVFYALAWAFTDRGDSALAKVCLLRVAELIDEEKRSLSPHFAHGGNWFSVGLDWLPRAESRNIEIYFELARMESDMWQTQRQNYTIQQIRTGTHPDTDSGFWSSWQETTSPPEFPSASLLSGRIISIFIIFILGGATSLIVLRGLMKTVRRVPPPPSTA